MAKRLTATEKWDDPWFCGLSLKNQMFWIYLLDKCNHAGIWQVNWSLVKFHIKGFRFDPEVFKGRILEITPHKWHVPKFIDFQYGALNPSNRAHASVISVLEKEGVTKGLGSPMLGAKDKEKDKDKDKEKVKDKERHLDFVWLTPEEHGKLKAKLGDAVEVYIARLNGYIGQIGEKKASAKYTSHYHTILNWHSKDKTEGVTNGTHVSAGISGLDPEKIRAAGYLRHDQGLRKDSSPRSILDGVRTLRVPEADQPKESEISS